MGDVVGRVAGSGSVVGAGRLGARAGWDAVGVAAGAALTMVTGSEGVALVLFVTSAFDAVALALGFGSDEVVILLTSCG